MHLSRHPTSYPTRWQEIAAKLEVELRTHYRCGDYLPAEQQLADRYEVNRHTLRRAIDQLVERGWVQRRQGVGVLVLMRPFDYPLNAQARFSQNLLDQGSHPTSEKLLSVLRPASSHVADALGIQEGEQRHPPAHAAPGQRRRGVPDRSLLRGPHPLAGAAEFLQRIAA